MPSTRKPRSTPSGGSTTTVLARDVLVLDSSVGSSNSLTSSDSGWITLAVDPDRVEEIVAASNKTDLYFVLPGQRIDEATTSNGSGASSKAEVASSDSSGASSGAEASSSESEKS